MFHDRAEAGKLLARALSYYKGKPVIVLAIPRGGTEVGYEVASYLRAKFSLLIVRKLPFPNNPEAGFGAIAEDGSRFIFKDANKWLSKGDRDSIIKYQLNEVKRRVSVLRQGKPLPKLKGRIVILVDDGLAMGSTIIAAIKACRKLGAKRVIVASPVGSNEVALRVRKLVDTLIILETPEPFYAVAQVYEKWHDVTDAEVLSFIKRSLKFSAN